jgi:hypothetical protein
MKAAVLLYRPDGDELAASLAWVDPFAGRVLQLLPVPVAPNLGVFPEHDCVLVSYPEYVAGAPPREWTDVYRLSDGHLRAHLAMDYRAHFNVSPEWSTFLPSPDGKLIYVYKAHTLGDHWGEDFVCGLDPATPAFCPWSFRFPECVAGWSASGGRAHVQALFVADGQEVGQLPTTDLDQKIAFWLGPAEGMGPVVSLGPRPRLHSELGHARAILFAPERPLSVVVCNNGVVHLIDPVHFHYLARQQVAFSPGQAMPVFAAHLEPQGRLLYVGTAAGEARHQGVVERMVVHDLDAGRRQVEWVFEEPFDHTALTPDGRHLCGVSRSSQLWVLDARTGSTLAAMRLDGSPRHVMPA